ncbi:MAG: hypothetical protein ACRC62_20400 [Microcoleus sp.]
MLPEKPWYGPTPEEFIASKPIPHPSFEEHCYTKHNEAVKNALKIWQKAESIQECIDLLSGKDYHYLVYCNHINAEAALNKFDFTLQYEEQLSSGFDGRRGLHYCGSCWVVPELDLSFKDMPTPLRCLEKVQELLRLQDLRK